MRGWTSIASLPALRSLHVQLSCEWRDLAPPGPDIRAKWVEERILDAIKEVRNVRQRFMVNVNWPRTEGFEIGDVDFELVRDVKRRGDWYV